MAASADQNIPVVVNLAATAINDSRVSDLTAVIKSASEYLGSAGYRVSEVSYPHQGAASTGFDLALDLPGRIPTVGKLIVWLTKHIWERLGKARLRVLEKHYPSITFDLEIPPELGLYDAPSYNAFGGLAAILPDLNQHLLKEHPNRRYSFEISAPASFSIRRQNAYLRGTELDVPKLLKLIKASGRKNVKDGTSYRFGTYFPHMLEIYPPKEVVTKLAR